MVVADRSAAVLVLGHLLTYAAEATVARGGSIEVEDQLPVGPVLIRFGSPSPIRDTPPPPLEQGFTTVRMTTGLAMAWVLAHRAVGAGALRAAASAGSGRLELWLREA